MKNRFFAVLLVLSVLLSGCSELTAPPATSTAPTDSGATVPTGAPVDTDLLQSDAGMFTDRDRDPAYNEKKAVTVQFNGDSAAASSNAVAINGTNVILTAEATYVLSGTLNDSSVIVDAGSSDKIQIVLSGVNITSNTSAAIYVKNADKVFVTLADGTENTLSNGGNFASSVDSSIDAPLFSRQDLTINGSGSLSIQSPAGHGIVCKDDLAITGGVYSIQTAGHGIDANDSIRIAGGTLNIESGKDGIHAENSDDTSLGFVYLSAGTLDLKTDGDGISAGSWLQLSGGNLKILAGGGSENGEKDHANNMMGPGGMGPGERPGGRPRSTVNVTTTEESTSVKGLKAAGNILISAGTFTIDSADDAIHGNTNVTVNGGDLTLKTGDDGLHADQPLCITGGAISITESYEGLEAQNIVVSGGVTKLKATDDGLNAAGGTDSSGIGGNRPGGDHFFGGMGGHSDGSIVISGGDLYINASGDGMDANGKLEITGGHTVVVGPTRGDTATLDYDISGTISGGTFIGTGASGMAQTFSDSAQGVVSVQVGSGIAGTQIKLIAADGTELISYAPELDFNVVILSTPEMVKGETYTLSVGHTVQEFKAN